MAQFARPASDITTGFTTAPLWSKLDEVAADDADFITGTGNAVTFEVKLSAVTDPAVGTGHVVTIRARATGSGGAERLNTWGLYQGGTAIATLNSVITRGSFNNYSITLTSTQADAITDYSDLRIRGLTSQAAGETIDVSWAQLEVPNATHALTATNITTGTPVLDAATIGQVHVLVPTGITTASPTLDAATIGQVHVLTSTGITTAAPTLDAPTLEEAADSDDLVATDITTAAPTLDAPTIGQVHALTSTDIVTAAPTLDAASIGQVHVITASGITTAAPTLDAPTIGQVHVLTANGITTAAPDLGAPTLTENDTVDDLVANGITTGTPDLGAPTIGQVHVLTALGITTGAPTMGTPVLDGAPTPPAPSGTITSGGGGGSRSSELFIVPSVLEEYLEEEFLIQYENEAAIVSNV